jgi:hypothetical protein
MISINPLRKSLLNLLLIDLILVCTGLLFLYLTRINISIKDILILISAFSLIYIISFQIFFRGMKLRYRDQAMYSLVSIVLKFLLELVLALIWFVAAKKNTLPCVVLFFVIYLTLTLYLVSGMLKVLKTKPL